MATCVLDYINIDRYGEIFMYTFWSKIVDIAHHRHDKQIK